MRLCSHPVACGLSSPSLALSDAMMLVRRWPICMIDSFNAPGAYLCWYPVLRWVIRRRDHHYPLICPWHCLYDSHATPCRLFDLHEWQNEVLSPNATAHSVALDYAELPVTPNCCLQLRCAFSRFMMAYLFDHNAVLADDGPHTPHRHQQPQHHLRWPVRLLPLGIRRGRVCPSLLKGPLHADARRHAAWYWPRRRRTACSCIWRLHRDTTGLHTVSSRPDAPCVCGIAGAGLQMHW